MMISSIISRLVILLFGNLYPAYASYKAVRTKNVKEYVKWMMYWIVFALFTCCETFTDVFLGFWFPFYYEIKIILVIWLLSPATKGSSFLYRKFVHPMLTKREPEIDEYLSRAKEQSYHTMLHLGTRGMTYATNVIMQTAIKQLPAVMDRQECIANGKGHIVNTKPVDMADGTCSVYSNCYDDDEMEQVVDEHIDNHSVLLSPPVARMTRSRLTRSRKAKDDD